jgi:hypothetical protein
MSALASSPAQSDWANATESRLFKFIFQLPAIKGRRTISSVLKIGLFEFSVTTQLSPEADEWFGYNVATVYDDIVSDKIPPGNLTN